MSKNQKIIDSLLHSSFFLKECPNIKIKGVKLVKLRLDKSIYLCNINGVLLNPWSIVKLSYLPLPAQNNKLFHPITLKTPKLHNIPFIYSVVSNTDTFVGVNDINLFVRKTNTDLSKLTNLDLDLDLR